MSDVDIERTVNHLIDTKPDPHTSPTRCLLDCDTLYRSIDAKRTRLGMSWRGIARQIGISASTFTRLHAGHPPNAHVLCSLIWWMDYGFVAYIRPNPAFHGERRPLESYTSYMTEVGYKVTS